MERCFSVGDRTLLNAAGVMVTVNSDDPPLFGTTLYEEYTLLAREWGYGAAHLERIARNALRDELGLTAASMARRPGG